MIDDRLSRRLPEIAARSVPRVDELIRVIEHYAASFGESVVGTC